MKKFSARFAFEKYDFVRGSLVIRTVNEVRFLSARFGEVVIPAKTISDGASVPRVFWTIFSPYDGDYFDAAVVHDAIYRNKDTPFSRKDADLIFLEAMEDLGVGWFKRRAVFRSVRLGGGKAWEVNRA
jgi:hypothetical protein